MPIAIHSHRPLSLFLWALLLVLVGWPATLHAQTAQEDTYTGAEDATLEISTPGVLGNDLNAHGAGLLSGPSHGVVTLSQDGAFVYTPKANFNGADAFTYAASAMALPSPAGFTIDPSQSSITLEARLSAGSISLSEQDTVPLGGTLTAEVDLGGDSVVDPFTHVAISELNVNAAAPLVMSVNIPGLGGATLTASPVVMTMDSHGAGASVRGGVFRQAGNMLRLTGTAYLEASGSIAEEIESQTQPVDFSVPFTFDGKLTAASGSARLELPIRFSETIVIPEEDINVEINVTGIVVAFATFTYTTSQPATVHLTIEPVLDVPFATADFYAGREDQALVVAAEAGLLANDVNPDDLPVSVILTAQAKHGEVTLNADGSFTFAPAPDFNGEDGFRYRLIHDAGSGESIDVSLNVEAVNDAPAITNAPATHAVEGRAYVYSVDAEDVDGDDLSFELRTAPVFLHFDGHQLRGEPEPSDVGTHAVTFAVSDGTDATEWSFTLTVAEEALYEPQDGTENVSVEASFEWKQEEGAAGYNFQLTTGSGVASKHGEVVLDTTVTSTSFKVPTGLLQPGTDYTWSVRTVVEGEATEWAPPASFTTVASPPGTPSLAAPADGATGIGDVVTLTWQAVAADAYEVQLSWAADFSTLVAHEVALADTALTIEGLAGSTTYFWRVRGQNSLGTSDWSAPGRFSTVMSVAAEDPDIGLPAHYLLSENYPNPFNPQTTITFGLPAPGPVKLAVFDLLGREVALLVDRALPAGMHTATFEADGLPSGLYLYRLDAASHSMVRTMTLLK